MATTRGPKADDEFMQHLYRGGELLAAGKVIEAKDYLEKAHKLQPRNEKGQNLLGLTYFKLGLFDRAAEIYELLVRENPADPTLRVNLGLVYLKANSLQRAIREFETATDLAPDHKKAHNYLGLALAQAGEYGRAKEHFVEAGSEAMAEKMDRAIAGEQVMSPMPSPAKRQGFAEIEGHDVVAERGGEQVEEIRVEVETSKPAGATAQGYQAPASAEDDMKFAEDEGPSAPAQDMSPNAKPSGAAVPPGLAAKAPAPADMEVSWEETPAQPVPAVEMPVLDASAVTESEPEPPKAPRPMQAALARPTEGSAPSEARLEKLAPSMLAFTFPLSEPFTVSDESAVAAVSGELLLRLERCVAVAGSVTFAAEKKRYRGRPSDRLFGEGDRQVVRAIGQGAVVLSSRGVHFEVVDMGDDSAYFREDVLTAFEEPLMFENGRVPGEAGVDLDLVHLRGTGRALLEITGTMRSLEVKMDRPAVIPLTRLVGWVGSLTPKLIPLWKEAGKSYTSVELSGEGFAFCLVARKE